MTLLRGPEREKADLAPRNLNGLDESYAKEERVKEGTNPTGPLAPAGISLLSPPDAAQPPRLSWLLIGETVIFQIGRAHV